MNILNNVSTIYPLIPFILGGITVVLFFRWLFKKEYRMYKNLERRIFLIGSDKETLEIERSIIKDSGFFNFDYVFGDPERALALIKSHIVIVWGYKKNYPSLKSFINILKAKNIALIVYATSKIDDEDKEIINSYSFSDIANSPLRLINLIFNLTAVLPYEKR